MADSYRRNYIYSGDNFSFFVAKVFCSWDYGITDKPAAMLKQKSIFNDLQVIWSFVEKFDVGGDVPVQTLSCIIPEVAFVLLLLWLQDESQTDSHTRVHSEGYCMMEYLSPCKKSSFGLGRCGSKTYNVSM